MKYMGSKRVMLAGQLGELLRSRTVGARRFIDLFVGSSAVACYVAENTAIKVVATDLQLFATVLAKAVIGREKPINSNSVWEEWLRRAQEYAYNHKELYFDIEKLERLEAAANPSKFVEEARGLCAASNLLIMQAYGGYYFSPKQSFEIDTLRATIPLRENSRSVALASLISAASACAASPGHTAQPLKPSATGARSLFNAWRQNIFSHTQSALKRISLRCAQVRGEAFPQDATVMASKLTEEDVAFIDPPYSDVHYSRFYHVLETIAVGKCSRVSGEGRYPPLEERPQSDFSLRSKSKKAIHTLLITLAHRGVKTILTFPQERTSNGLSGTLIEEIASQYFRIDKTVVNGRFSTLGGNLRNRSAQVPAYEIILVLKPK